MINPQSNHQFYGIFAQGKNHYVVMELMEYGSLETYLKENKSNSTPTVRNVRPTIVLTIFRVYNICSGMLYLTERCVIHRDLAARNVFIGTNNSVKVIYISLLTKKKDWRFWACKSFRKRTRKLCCTSIRNGKNSSQMVIG
jgi:serine/threonine protein kinase